MGAWRHIVTLFRQEGAENVTWLWTLEADQPGTGPIASWWPGASYVTWVGIDGYYYRPSRHLRQRLRHDDHPGADVHQQAGAAVGDRGGQAVGSAADQIAKIQDLFHGMAKYKTLGLVWFDKTQHGSIFHQDWRLADKPLAQISFRLGVRLGAGALPPDWLGAERIWLSRYTEPDG